MTKKTDGEINCYVDIEFLRVIKGKRLQPTKIRLAIDGEVIELQIGDTINYTKTIVLG